VNERAYRRRTFHGVGQPDVQRELGGFADRSAEEQQQIAVSKPSSESGVAEDRS